MRQALRTARAVYCGIIIAALLYPRAHNDPNCNNHHYKESFHGTSNLLNNTG